MATGSIYLLKLDWTGRRIGPEQPLIPTCWGEGEECEGRKTV